MSLFFKTLVRLPSIYIFPIYLLLVIIRRFCSNVRVKRGNHSLFAFDSISWLNWAFFCIESFLYL